METLIAPSEIPGISTKDASGFGNLAEDLIYADFCRQYAFSQYQLFKDDNNPQGYLYFLARNNAAFTEQNQRLFYTRLKEEQLYRVPDLMVHTGFGKVFYEIKPYSDSGIRAGAEKVAYLNATYKHFNLPYVAGRDFVPTQNQRLAYLKDDFTVDLQVQQALPGLILYRLRVQRNYALDFNKIVGMLTYTVKALNEQRGSLKIRPINLASIF
jgi:hypothetical protein